MLLTALPLAILAMPPKPITITVKRDIVVAKVKETFQGVQVTVGPDRIGPTGKIVPGSAIQFGPNLGNRRVEFSVPEQTRDLGLLGKVTYRPNGISVRDTSVRATNQEYEVVLYFKSNGPALKGRHSWLGDGGAPDIDLEAAHVIVRMTPKVHHLKELYFAEPKVMFYADVKTQGLSWDIMGRRVDLLDSVTGYRDKIKYAIEEQLAKALAGPNARSLLSQKVGEFIESQASAFRAEVVSLQMIQTDLKMTLRRKSASGESTTSDLSAQE